MLNGQTVLSAATRGALEEGVCGILPGLGHKLELQLKGGASAPRFELRVDGQLAPQESEICAPPSRAAMYHALQALFGSLAGFASSALYLHKAALHADIWARKMGVHTLGWHLLLVFTLFPASLWGQRLGIRAVQLVSAVFFAIHLGIAIANWAAPASPQDFAIAALNLLSGFWFLVALLYGQRAYRTMDPLAALRAGRAKLFSRAEAT